jgi:Mrp family chromosome partitioning ATPase
MIEEYNRQNLDTATLARDFLRRKQTEADTGVDDASRKLAEFLAEHPQFQWGVNDSPYAPTPLPSAAAPVPGRAAPRAAASTDPALAELNRSLGRVEAELFASPTEARPVPLAGAGLGEAQRQRDAAAAALSAAAAALADKLLSVKPAHPDAVSAAARVSAARSALAAAEATLARTRNAGEQAFAERPSPSLTPERRAQLEAQRASIRRQIDAHRAGLPPSGAVADTTRPRDAAAEPSVVELETEWHRLRLDLDRAREKLHTIQQTARAADLSADAVARQGHEEMQVFEPAYLPTRPDRGHGRVFFVGATLALFVALGYAALRVLLDDTLLDEGDVSALGGPPVLVTMPRIEPMFPPPAERAIVPTVRRDDDPDAEEVELCPPPSADGSSSQRGLVVCVDRDGEHPLVEAFFDDPEVEVIGADLGSDAGATLGGASPAALATLRVLRHRLEQRRGDGSFVVTVMSPGRGEGKTTLALRLAVTLSEAERARVILVDGHFAEPRLAAALGLRLPDEAGFSTQLHERMHGRGVAWGVVRLGPSLSLLGEPGETAAHPEAIHSAHFESALAALRRSCEYVVIDGPGVVGSGDANVLEAVSDGVLLLVRVGVTRGAALGRATQQLGDRRVLGVVLNDVVEPAPPRAGQPG